MVLRKKVAIFDWEWDRNSAPRDGQKIPCDEKYIPLIGTEMGKLGKPRNLPVLNMMDEFQS